MGQAFFVLLLLLPLSVSVAAQTAKLVTGVDKSPHTENSVTANNIKLHYLDWGGKGETMLFLTGMGVTPHIFDDLAAQFSSRFRVVGLTRRGVGKSDKPETGYDTGTLVEDIRGFLDALKVERVTLVGWSLAGTEMTRFATLYPTRVNHLVYLDSAYDYSTLPEIWAKDPVTNAPTKEDSASLEASRRWFTRVFGFWSDAVEADARAINLQPDGTMKLDPLPESVSKQLLAGMIEARPDFTKVKAPALAFYAVSQTHPGVLDSTDAETRRKANGYWSEVFLPDQQKQIARFRRSVANARIVELHGAQHLCFIKERDEKRIVREMLAFLSGSKAPVAPAASSVTEQPSKAFFALSVADVEALSRWYAEKLGFRVLSQGEAPNRVAKFAILEGAGALVEMIQHRETKPRSVAAPDVKSAHQLHGIFKVGMVVRDIDGVYREIRKRGVPIIYELMPAKDVPQRSFSIRDVEGNMIQFFGR